MTTTGHEDFESIAIIGMDGRFPGADTVDDYWKNLVEGRECIERFDADALDASVPESLRKQAEYVSARGVMRDADKFDAAFFDISPREAEVLDPQQRVFLEMCWRALEDSGYTPGTHKALTGVFAGMSYNTYFNAHVAKHPEILASFGDIPALVANEKDYLATRVGYKFDLRGPCINISTACSTSLVAVCHAFNSLLDYQCDIALAGGVSVLCPQERGYLYQEGGIYSPDGHCRPFDANAQGTVFGNGGGVVVLKRLSDAVADGDTIHAVIRGVAMNNDGAGKVSFTAPSVEGQADVVRMAQELAGVRADDITYVEAHGTGTSLGDPIEIAALTKAFQRHTDARGYCGIGSAKGNIGHLDAASGIAGLIKAALALRERKLPATLHYTRANPALGLEQSPFHVIDETRDWPADGKPRLAAVSSFGLGGTNAHVVLEEAPVRETSAATTNPQLLVLSAKTEAALDRACDAVAHYLNENEQTNFADIAFTLQLGRQAFEHRLAVAANDRTEAANILNGKSGARVRRGKAGNVPRTVFMFPGQGSQYAGMCERIYHAEPVVRDLIDRCADALRDVLEFDLRDVMFDRIDNASELLDETAYTQPALFATEYALARLWMEWGVAPDALTGHSIGEFVAAALAEVFRPEDAIRAVAERARLMQAQDSGSMLSLRMSEAAARELLEPGIELAAVNAPELCVVSGSDANIQRFRKRLEAKDIACRVLRTSHAFHSAMMDPVVEPFRDVMQGMQLNPPTRTVISTVTGRELSPEEATDPVYWARQLREPVRFVDALRTARGEGDASCLFLEVGPGIAAATFVTQAFGDDSNVQIAGSLGRNASNESELSSLLDTAGRLWTQGMPLNWKAMHAGAKRRRVPLPTYRFERTRYWLESTGPGNSNRNTPMQAGTIQARTPVEDGPVIDRVAALLADVSGVAVDEGRYETRFTELGLDSLFLTQFGQSLKKHFGVNLRFRELLVEHDTVAAVATLIEQQAPPEKTATKPVVSKTAKREAVPAAKQELTKSQRAYIAELTKRYTWRTSGSKAFVRTHRSHLADPRTVAGFDPALKEMVYPIVTQSSSGSHLQDVDGNAWIDLVNGFGSNLLGHSAPFITDAIRQQLKRGYDVGPQTALAGRVARQLQAMTGFSRVSFCSTGSEAVQAAVRVARTVTARDKIVMFADDYHGIFDEVLARRGNDGRTRPASPGVPESVLADIEVLEYGSDASLQRIRELGDTLAAVLVEPVQGLHPERYSPTFLRELRAETKRSDAALIFDEIITGFRVHPGGVQGMLDVRADLTTYGNVCGGGMPIGVLAGEPRFMDALDGGDWQYNDDSAPHEGVTFFAGTFMRHPLALAAAEAALTHLLEAGPALQKTLNERTERFVRELEQVCEETGAPIRFRRFSSWFLIDIDKRVPCGRLLYYRLRAGGVHAWEDRLCFLTAAHTDLDLAQIRRVFRESVEEMRDAGFFEKIPASKERIPEAAEKTMPSRVAVGASAPPVPNARLGRRPDGQPGWFVPDPERPGRYRELTNDLKNELRA
ncbi:MAG TPA: aminotransferase class III-fold pyridoxal phosphate-dependent enzyme [Gammaproteobacteria bacterium]